MTYESLSTIVQQRMKAIWKNWRRQSPSSMWPGWTQRRGSIEYMEVQTDGSTNRCSDHYISILPHSNYI